MKKHATAAFVLLYLTITRTISFAQEKKDSIITNDNNISKDSIIDQNNSGSENDDQSPPDKKRSYFRAGITYLSNNVYLGRKDSVPLQYLTPKIGYYAKSGFFVEGSAGILSNSGDSRFDMFSLASGYSFSAGDYDGEFTASKYFYNNQSTNVKSEVKASLEYYNSYDFGFISPTILTTLNIGTKVDFASAFGLEHSFILISDQMEVTPTLLVNASTQNYYDNYYKKRRFAMKRKGKVPASNIAAISGEVLNASTFKVLDYEASLPINFETGRFKLSFTPTYAVPVHPAEVVVTTKLTDGTSTTHTGFEKIKSTFYAELAIAIKF
jgi:hypothetical protein